MVINISKRWFQRTLRLLAITLVVGLPLGLFIYGAKPIAVGLVPPPWDKLAHVAVFAVLAGAMGGVSGLRGRHGLLVCFGAALAVGAVDEWHQMYLPGRSAGLDDLVADAFGAALGALALLWFERRENRLLNQTVGR